MHKITKKQQSIIDRARIQRAVTGLIIPIMSIGTLSRKLEKMIAEGASDEALAAGAKEFL
jgi:hypothetical protein